MRIKCANFSFETSDGTKRREEGTFLKSDDAEGGILRVIGFFSYIGSDGVTYTVKYIADENGFQPEGEHLPRAEQEQVRSRDVDVLKIMCILFIVVNEIFD